MANSRYAHVAEKNPSWDRANDLFRQYENFSCKPATRKLKPDHIENVHKTVVWNQQFVAKNNQKHLEEVQTLNRRKNALLFEARDMVKYLICDELDWKLTDDDVERYFDEWNDRYRDEGFAYMCHHIKCECNWIRKMDWWKAMNPKR